MSGTGNGSAGGTEYPVVGRQVHRHYALELKRRIVEETFAPGASVSIVARRHDVNANLVFDWRNKYRQGKLGYGKPSARAATVTPDPATRAGPALIRIGVVEDDGGMRALPVVTSHSALPDLRATRCDGATARREEPALPETRSAVTPGIIEIELSGGIRVRVNSGFDEAVLRRVLAVIKELA